MVKERDVPMHMEMERMPGSHDHDHDHDHGMGEAKAMVYPSPLYTHEEVVRDGEAFMDALRHFHSSLGSKLSVPVIGGKALDLHLLYVEVTKRGGLEKVIKERKWGEVKAEFNFPPTTTSASFVLRKYYLSLLHHFEQVYFFGGKGQLVPPSASSQTRMPRTKLNNPNSAASGAEEDRAMPKPSVGGSCNFNVTGSIDGRFDYGYLVTVKIGDETLRGALYHVPDQPQITATPNLTADQKGSPTANVPILAQKKKSRRNKRQKCKQREDPNNLTTEEKSVQEYKEDADVAQCSEDSPGKE